MLVVCAALGGIGWVLGGYSLCSIFAFSGVLLGAATYWFADRAVLGLVRARGWPLSRAWRSRGFT